MSLVFLYYNQSLSIYLVTLFYLLGIYSVCSYRLKTVSIFIELPLSYQKNCSPQPCRNTFLCFGVGSGVLNVFLIEFYIVSNFPLLSLDFKNPLLETLDLNPLLKDLHLVCVLGVFLII